MYQSGKKNYTKSSFRHFTPASTLTDVLNDSSSKKFLGDVKSLAESLIAEYGRHDDSPDGITGLFFYDQDYSLQGTIAMDTFKKACNFSNP